MKSIFVLFFIIISSNMLSAQSKIDSIFKGKSGLLCHYYDDTKDYKVVEIDRIKGGYLDYLTDVNDHTIIAVSKYGKLYHKGMKIYYKNDSLNINCRFKKCKYNLPKDDDHRWKIFGLDARTRSIILAQKLNLKDYVFKFNTENDYLYYRDNKNIPKDYVPNYIKDIYMIKEKQNAIN